MPEGLPSYWGPWVNRCGSQLLLWHGWGGWGRDDSGITRVTLPFGTAKHLTISYGHAKDDNTEGWMKRYPKKKHFWFVPHFWGSKDTPHACFSACQWSGVEVQLGGAHALWCCQGSRGSSRSFRLETHRWALLGGTTSTCAWGAARMAFRWTSQS